MAANSTVSLKLLIHRKSKRVLFAEGGRDFVDFLSNIISLPAGTMIKLLGKTGTAGCTTNNENKAKVLYLEEEGGFVQGAAAKFMIMDDLVVRPMNTESIITLFSKFKIKGLGDLEVKVVDVGVDEGVELLRALMQSKDVLTAVFLSPKESSKVRVGGYCCLRGWIRRLFYVLCFILAVNIIIEERLSELQKGRRSP